MGRLKSNAPGSCNRHSPTRDSRDSDGRLFGSLAAFKLAIKPSLKKNRSDSFRKAFTPEQEHRVGWAFGHVIGRPGRKAAETHLAPLWVSASRELDFRGIGKSTAMRTRV